MNKVLLLIDNLGSGGAQRQWTILAKGLIKYGYNVTLVRYYEQDFYANILEPLPIKQVLIKKTEKIGVNFFLQLRKLMLRENFEAVFSIMNTPNFYATLLKKTIRQDFNCIISHCNKTDFNKISLLDATIRKWSSKNADKVVCNSFHEKNTWVNHIPDLSNKIYTIYNGVETERFYPPTPFRKKQNKLLIVGSISPLKNGLMILKAIKSWKDQGNEYFKITWIGRIDHDVLTRKKYAEKVFAYIDKYRLHDWVEIIEPTQNILPFYHQHDALLLASHSEGLPNVACESLMTGLPLIISNVLDHPVLVSDGIEGFLFDPYKIDELHHAWKQFFSLSVSAYTQLQQNCLSKSKQLCSEEKNISQYVKLMEEIN